MANLHTPTVTIETYPRYVAALEGQSVDIRGQFSDQDEDDLDYILRINSQVVSEGRAHYVNGYEQLSYATKPGDLNPGRNGIALSASDGVHMASASQMLHVDENITYPTKELEVTVKGICYSPGLNAWVHDFPVYPEPVVEEHMTVIRDELGCNGIKLFGDLNDAMITCARLASARSFDQILLAPMYIDASPEKYCEEFEELSKAAEALRQDCQNVRLLIGNELAGVVRGIIPGDTYTERARNIGKVTDWGPALEKLLKELLYIARKHFRGMVSYAAGNWEGVDWRQLDVDFICENEYKDWYHTNVWLRNRIGTLKRYGKPVHVTEFGTSTFEGADQYGGGGWLEAGTYSEEAQASYIRDYLEFFNQLGIDGCCLFEFTQNTDYNPPIDMGIMKFIDERHFIRKKAFYMYKSYQRSP